MLVLGFPLVELTFSFFGEETKRGQLAGALGFVRLMSRRDFRDSYALKSPLS